MVTTDAQDRTAMELAEVCDSVSLEPFPGTEPNEHGEQMALAVLRNSQPPTPGFNIVRRMNTRGEVIPDAPLLELHRCAVHPDGRRLAIATNGMPSDPEHEVTIRSVKAHFVARCRCGWRATGSGEQGEERVGRKADAHLRAS